MNLLWAVLTVVLAVLVLIVVCGVVIRVQKKRPDRHYDERQIAARGKAYEFGFTVCVVYYALITVLMPFQADQWTIAPHILIFVGVLFSILAVQIYCLMTDAMLPLNRSSSLLIGTSFFAGAVNLWALVSHIFREGLVVNNEPTGVWLELVMCVYCLSQATIYLIAERRSKRSDT